MNQEYSRKKDPMKSIQVIIDLYTKTGLVPTASRYDEKAKGDNELLARRNLEKSLNMKWSQICTHYLGSSNMQRKDREEIYEELLRIKNILGRTPKAVELRKFNFNFKQCYRAYNMTYNKTVESFGWEISGHSYTKKSIEEMLEDYASLFRKLNRIPLFEDIEQEINMVSVSTYRKKIGDIFEICKLSGININKYIHSIEIGSGYLFYDDNNELCLSRGELLISNFLIENGISFQKEVPYNRLIEGTNKRYRFDWYLPDYNLCIEYFGLYDKNSVGKSNRIGRYADSVNKKIKLCSENGVNLISIYSNDIKNDLKGVKNKILPHLRIS